jgi:hypothetical protein
MLDSWHGRCGIGYEGATYPLPHEVRENQTFVTFSLPRKDQPYGFKHLTAAGRIAIKASKRRRS